MPQQPSPAQDYRYNGKERLPGSEIYAYGFRHYDPTVGRFMGVDPISDRFAWASVYNYAENEPVGHIDLWGLQRALPQELTAQLQNFRSWIYNKTGLDIPLTGQSRPKPRVYIEPSIEFSGNIQVGAGLDLGANLFGADVRVNADIGSVKILEGQATLDKLGVNFDGNIADRNNNTFERNGGLFAKLPFNAAFIGAQVEENTVERNGKVVSETTKIEAGIMAKDQILGISRTTDQMNSDVKETSIDFGLGGQIFLGGEVKVKANFKSSTDRKKLE